MGIQPTNAGIDFQQRVSAWFMINMLFDIELSNSLNIGNDECIGQMVFEADAEIDDLVLITENNKKVYMQMKRNINLSSEVSSEFYKTCEQFVKQYIQHDSKDVAFLLVTTNNASSNICEILRRVLNSIRASESFGIVDAFNKKENEVFDKVCKVIESIYLNITQEKIHENDKLELFKKMYVEIFDIEDDQSFEKTVKLALRVKISVDVDLFWGYMIKLALNFASKRQTITNQYLKDNLNLYLSKTNANKNMKLENQLMNIRFENDSWSVDKDFILALKNEELENLLKQNEIDEMIENPQMLYMLELYRFESDGTRRLKYISPNRVIMLINGIELEIIYRSATMKGIERFIKSEYFANEYKGYSVYFLMAGKRQESLEVEKLHKTYIIDRLKEKQEVRCLNCGKPIFQEEALCCELDNQEVGNDAGIVHKECLLPVDRVLGTVRMPNINEYNYLKNFDVNLFTKLIKNGQGFTGELAKLNYNIKHMIVKTKDIFYQGNYMLKIYLDNGSFVYATDKGNIRRLGKSEAEEFEKQFNESFKEEKKNGNPFCYSSESLTFGQYNLLVKLIGGREEYLECTKTEVVKYNEGIANLYSKCKNFYAPLIYLTIDDKPLVVNDDSFPLFTNPLEIKTYLENWEKQGIDISGYNVNIIKDDNEFCLRLLSAIKENVRPIANMKLGKNGELISGIVFLAMDEVQSSNVL